MELEEYKILYSPEKIYNHMLEDISKAKKEILLETYIYSDDKIGKEFREELTKKALEGVKVRVLIDAWGSGVKKKFFKKLILAGGKVRFFRKFRHTFKIVSENHQRNHRKLLLIDKKISYIGSINITSSCLKWEELVIRFHDPLAVKLSASFNRTWKRFDIFKIKKTKRIIYKDFQILPDVPTGKISFTGRKYVQLISKARKEILITTPYFLPSQRIRRALRRAAKRGVKIKVLLPKVSDHAVLDSFRNRYLRRIYHDNITIYYYPKILHSKLLISDDKFFLMGSSNLDYRSFMHQFELNLLGKNKKLISDLKKHFYRNLLISVISDSKVSHKQSILSNFLERIIHPFREFL